jgi:acetolactate synthase-1/2/3 large subunit
MGGGCAAAVGAKLAAPERQVVCPTGDGAFQMFMKELPAAVQCGAAVTFVVLNNRALGWVKYGQRRRGERYIAVDFDIQPDFVQVARASHCFGERVEQPQDIRPALQRARQANEEGQTAVVEFVVDGVDFAYGFQRFYERLS